MKLYMHAGCFNHGCEAIVRSTANMINKRVVLYSEHPEEDIAVNLDRVCDIKIQGGSRSKTNPAFVVCKAAEILFRNPAPKHWYAYKNVISEAKPGELYLSIGGDNYCYGANPYLMYLNYALNKRGARTGLWGCSIEPAVLKDDKIVQDMKRYSFISARETITYNALIKAGLHNVYLYPDPAFTLEKREWILPESFKKTKVVGINLSPLVQKLDGTDKLVLENYVNVIKYILNETEMSIALIPHVCKPGNDDRDSLRTLASAFPDEPRIFLVNEDGTMDCQKLKYVIGKCRFVIAARTHASIAAYSSCVPTLVVGYSVKARGIARDLFEREDGYVIDIHKLTGNKELLNEFLGILSNGDNVKAVLSESMDSYILKARDAVKLLG